MMQRDTAYIPSSTLGQIRALDASPDRDAVSAARFSVVDSMLLSLSDNSPHSGMHTFSNGSPTSIRPRRGLSSQLATIKIVGKPNGQELHQDDQADGYVFANSKNDDHYIDSANTIRQSQSPTRTGNNSRAVADIFHSPLASPLPVMSATMKGPPQFGWDEFESAPTPSVPAGPRRYDDPTASPWTGQAPTSPTKNVLHRKPSLKTQPTNISMRSSKTDAVDTATREEAWRYVQASNSMRTASTSSVQPVPTLESSRRSSQTGVREQRPGFFRRMFGNSKPHDDNKRHGTPTRDRSLSIDRPKTQAQQYVAALPNYPPPPVPTNADARPTTSRPMTQEHTPTGLKKSHSSFFRRRKKSVSEHDPMPARLKTANRHVAPVIPSAPPMSPEAKSLRQAMDSYMPTEGDREPNESFGSKLAKSKTTDPGSVNRATSKNSIGNRDFSKPDVVKMKTVEGSADIAKIKEVSISMMNADRGGVTAPGTTAASLGPTQGLGRGLGAQPSNSVRDVPPAVTSTAPSQPSNDDGSRTMFERIIDDSDDDDGNVRPGIWQSEREREQTSRTSERVWIEPESSEEEVPTRASLKIGVQQSRQAVEAAPISPLSDSEVFVSATSTPVVLRNDNRELSMKEFLDRAAILPDGLDEATIRTEDRERAAQILSGDELVTGKDGAAAWLGQNTTVSARTRKAYMDLFDLSGISILASFRELCSRLALKAESQQLDRVIDAFAERWCACNPRHGFKEQDVVHTITYSILMLNTDLHIDRSDKPKMSRAQYVKNTLPTIKGIAEAAEILDSEPVERAPSRQVGMSKFSKPSSPTPYGNNLMAGRGSMDNARSRGRLSVGPVIRHDPEGMLDFRSLDQCNNLVDNPFPGSQKAWESQIETVLKEFYNSIKSQKLPLHGAPDSRPSQLRNLREEPSNGSLSVMGMTNALRRTPSVLSRAPSETMSYKGRGSDMKNMSRFASKNRATGKPRLYQASSTFGSSKTSLSDQSVFSPAPSMWSKMSMGKTLGSTSMDSLGGNSFFTKEGEYHQAIGFANALAQAVIREETGASINSDEYEGRPVPLLEDETLSLQGPPWAKEGIVKHRYHIVSGDGTKKSKDKNWVDCFAVIDKGWLKLFSFASQSSAKSTGRARGKSKSSASGGGNIVGGGNWMDQASALGEYLLRQTIAAELPKPGFAKDKPYCFALTLPNGAVHLFSVGTAEIVKEFVVTANYWSARLSKEPLVGGISNIEYGWGDGILSQLGSTGTEYLLHRDTSNTSNTSSSYHSPRPSTTQASLRRPSVDQMTINSTLSSNMKGAGRVLLPGDKVHINEWAPPAPAMTASNLMEVDQLKALGDYVDNIEEDLKRHNELRGMMGLAFTPRGPNAAKAMSNWEKKSSYLLREIVKFRTYIESLTAAQAAKRKLDEERRVEMGKSSQATVPLGTNNPPPSTNLEPTPSFNEIKYTTPTTQTLSTTTTTTTTIYPTYLTTTTTTSGPTSLRIPSPQPPRSNSVLSSLSNGAPSSVGTWDGDLTEPIEVDRERFDLGDDDSIDEITMEAISSGRDVGGR